MGVSESEAEGSTRGWAFGPFRLLPMRKLLLDGDTPVRLGGRAFDILTVLVERAGQVITKEELMARVWPEISVDDTNLRVHVAALRKLLGHGQQSARYIINDAGRGYCLVAPVRPVHELTARTPAGIENEQASNLPAPIARVIGRASVVATVAAQLPELRLVTLVGPGGVGKTTVAVAAAHELYRAFAGGVHFVDLALAADPHLVPGAVAEALGLSVFSSDPTASLVRYLRDRRVLLVLDNCEHVVAAAAVLAERLLKDAPALHILTTSREPLRAEGERVHRLAPLKTPPPLQRLTAAEALEFPAVQLFVERSGGGPGTPELTDSEALLIADICRRLDGIPLAIELAAGQVNVFGLSALATILDDRFRLLIRGRRTALPRHRTLGAMLDWSFELLPEAERFVLMRLSLFAGSFTLEAANFVVAHTDIDALAIVDSIASLAEKSLITADVSGTSVRYRLLETTRAYAREKLMASGTLPLFARRHAEYHVSLFETAETEYDTLPTKDWLDRYGRQIDDVRTALSWAFAAGGDTATGVALTVAAVPLWASMSLFEECARGVERALASLQSTPNHGVRQDMRLHAALATALLFSKGVVPEIRAAWSRVLEIARKLGDLKYGLQALEGLWVFALNSSEFHVALSIAEEARSEAARSADAPGLLCSDRMVGTALHYIGDQGGARRVLEKALNRGPDVSGQPPIRGTQVDPRISARATLARTLWIQGFPDQARQIAEEGFVEAQRSGNATLLCFALTWGIIPVARLNGDLAAAEDAAALQLRVSEQHGLVNYHTWCLCVQAMLRVNRGDVSAGIVALRASLDELRERRMTTSFVARLGDLAEALGLCGQVAEGLSAIDEALRLSETNDERWCTAELLRIKAELMLIDDCNQPERTAETLFAESLGWARRQSAQSWELRTSTGLARLLHRRGRLGEAYRLLSSAYQRFTEGFTTADLRVARTLLDDWLSEAGVRRL
jgi:predicted ATPase/DNA-binding winged helix-turn-helix (wHTH) protein